MSPAARTRRGSSSPRPAATSRTTAARSTAATTRRTASREVPPRSSPVGGPVAGGAPAVSAAMPITGTVTARLIRLDRVTDGRSGLLARPRRPRVRAEPVLRARVRPGRPRHVRRLRAAARQRARRPLGGVPAGPPPGPGRPAHVVPRLLLPRHAARRPRPHRRGRRRPGRRRPPARPRPPARRRAGGRRARPRAGRPRHGPVLRVRARARDAAAPSRRRLPRRHAAAPPARVPPPGPPARGAARRAARRPRRVRRRLGAASASSRSRPPAGRAAPARRSARSPGTPSSSARSAREFGARGPAAAARADRRRARRGDEVQPRSPATASSASRSPTTRSSTASRPASSSSSPTSSVFHADRERALDGLLRRPRQRDDQPAVAGPRRHRDLRRQPAGHAGAVSVTAPRTSQSLRSRRGAHHVSPLEHRRQRSFEPGFGRTPFAVSPRPDRPRPADGRVDRRARRRLPGAPRRAQPRRTCPTIVRRRAPSSGSTSRPARSPARSRPTAAGWCSRTSRLDPAYRDLLNETLDEVAPLVADREGGMTRPRGLHLPVGAGLDDAVAHRPRAQLPAADPRHQADERRLVPRPR